MQISYTEPLARGYAHMKRMLFEPFDLGKWFALGFGCWLARLADGGGGGGGNFSNVADLFDDSDAATFAAWELPEIFREDPWLLGCGALGIFLIVLLILLIPLLIWLSSRGQFVFLDNVVHDRAEVRNPWNRFSALGNSLFLWRLGFYLAAIVLIVLTIAPLFFAIFYLENDSSSDMEAPLVLLGLVPMIVAGIGIGYVSLFLQDFVVPIMHLEGLATNAAWRRFLPLLWANVGKFLIYGLVMVVLWICVGIAVVLVILFTCCLAAIPLILPYIGTVALLPVYVTFRAFSLEFLQQLMPSVGLASALAPQPAVPEVPGPGVV